MEPILAPSPHRAVEVTGQDRASYLEAVLSQRIEGLPPGTATSALYLDVHGSPLAVLDVAVLDDRLVLVVPEQLADELVEVLGGRTFLADARFSLLEAEVIRLRGAETDHVAIAAGLPAGSGASDLGDGVVVLGSEHGLDLIGPSAPLAGPIASLEEHGARLVDDSELAAWEVAHGVPRWGDEIVAGHLPEELGLLPTHVHLAKGCYPGQEAVARMWQLGRPRRRLAVVAADDAVDAGWETGSGRARARVTRVADRDGKQVALAFVPGDAEEGDRFEAEDGTGIDVESFVGAGIPVPGHDPEVARRRDRR